VTLRVERRKTMSSRQLKLLALFCTATALLGQGPAGINAHIERPDLVPPVWEWYSCVNDLAGKPFDRRAAEACLKSILSHPHLSGGKLVVEPHRGYTTIVFRLASPSLTLAKVNFGLPPELEVEFERQWSVVDILPRVGETYDNVKASGTVTRLDDFLKSKGILALVTYETVLDYNQKTATVSYTIWEGPPIGPREPMYPEGINCSDHVGNVNEINIDDYTPLTYVDDILALTPIACFSREKLDHAVGKLRDTGIFSMLEVETSLQKDPPSPNEQWWDVTVTARANPTKVGRILYKRYGILSKIALPQWPQIPLAEGQPYARSDARDSESALTKFLTKPGMKVLVYQEVEPGPDHQLSVTFHLIGGTVDTVWMDGKKAG
jgi:hypothetical protein